MDPFRERHAYPPGQAPADVHPALYGPLLRHDYGVINDPWIQDAAVAVHSSARRGDGWSHHVVQMQAWPAWLGYFHHAGTGRRIIHAQGGPPDLVASLARVFSVRLR